MKSGEDGNQVLHLILKVLYPICFLLPACSHEVFSLGAMDQNPLVHNGKWHTPGTKGIGDGWVEQRCETISRVCMVFDHFGVMCIPGCENFTSDPVMYLEWSN